MSSSGSPPTSINTDSRGLVIQTHEHDEELFSLHPVRRRQGVYVQPADNDPVPLSTEDEMNQALSEALKGKTLDAGYAGDGLWDIYTKGKVGPFLGTTVCLKQALPYDYTICLCAYTTPSEVDSLALDSESIIKELEHVIGTESPLKAHATFEGWEAPHPNDDWNRHVGDFPYSQPSMWLDMHPEIRSVQAACLTSANLASWGLTLDPNWLKNLSLDDELMRRVTELQWEGTGRVDWRVVVHDDGKSVLDCP